MQEENNGVTVAFVFVVKEKILKEETSFMSNTEFKIWTFDDRTSKKCFPRLRLFTNRELLSKNWKDSGIKKEISMFDKKFKFEREIFDWVPENREARLKLVNVQFSIINCENDKKNNVNWSLEELIFWKVQLTIEYTYVSRTAKTVIGKLLAMNKL